MDYTINLVFAELPTVPVHGDSRGHRVLEAGGLVPILSKG